MTAARPRFQRGVMEYPNIGDGALLLTERELRLVYGGADADHAHIGDLQQNSDKIGVHIDIDQSGEPAFRHRRRHRRRQIERRRHHPAEYSRAAAEPAHLPGRSAQRIWPLLRRQGAGAHPAQSAAAVLAVQFRGNGRRLLRRPSRRRRGSRNPFRSYPAGEVGLSAIPRRPRQPAHQEAAIRATPASPPTRRCPTASRISSTCSTSAWASWRTARARSSITS